MSELPDDGLDNKAHWAKYVLSVTVPHKGYPKAVQEVLKNKYGITMALHKIKNIRNGRSHNRLVNKIIHDLYKSQTEDPGAQGNTPRAQSSRHRNSQSVKPQPYNV